MSEGGLELGSFCSRERYLNRLATATLSSIYLRWFYCFSSLTVSLPCTSVVRRGSIPREVRIFLKKTWNYKCVASRRVDKELIYGPKLKFDNDEFGITRVRYIEVQLCSWFDLLNFEVTNPNLYKITSLVFFTYGSNFTDTHKFNYKTAESRSRYAS